MKNFTDEKLIEIYKMSKDSRSKKAFDCLYLRYLQPITNYFFLALDRDNEKAKDFFHDLFLKILEKPDVFNTKQKFKPWIYRVASNMSKNHFRSKTVKNKYNEHLKYTETAHYDLDLQEQKLNDHIKNLKSEQRSLIVLRFKLNLSIKEIAEIYECPEGTIKSRLFYTIKELSNQYNKMLKI